VAATAPFSALSALALLLFLGTVGGAVYGTQAFLGDTVTAQLVTGTPAHETLNATAGHEVTYAITLANRDDAARDMAARLTSDIGQGTSEVTRVAAGQTAAVFVTVSIDADAAAGSHALSLDILNENGETLRTRPDLATLRILAPAPGFQAGDTAVVYYAGHLADSGRTFNTNDPRLASTTFPKTDQYQFTDGAFEAAVGRVVPGFSDALIDMQAGESRTVTFPAEKGYGPATEEVREKRFEDLDRRFDLELQVDSVNLDTFDGYIEQTSQGDPASFVVGDVFYFEQGVNRWPYLIVSKDNTSVGYTLQVSEGENFTLYPFWEGASHIVSVNDTNVVFETTPTTALGEMFTMRGDWPDATRVVSTNATVIRVEHAPEVGLQYGEAASPLGGGGATLTITEITADEIVAVKPASHPLAGKALTFDIQVLELRTP